MTVYFRPVAQTDHARPKGAMPLAGGTAWFSHAERLERDRLPNMVPATEIPDQYLERLSAPRPPIAGLELASPRLMGVLNVTPDSFSDGGRFAAPDVALAQAGRLIADGADILDIGGESTRPGAEIVPEDEEISRTVPIIAALRGQGVETPISIDTRKGRVARAALAAGADLINDVSALGFDRDLFDLARTGTAPICLMHAQGDPKTMQANPVYDDVLLDVYDYLAARVAAAEAAGISRARLIVDPGIGFGKTQAHNLALIRGLSLFHGLGCAVLLGVSRKRFIGTIGGEEQADRRAPGSIALGLEGIRQGIQLLRVHDVGQTRQAVALWQAAR